MSTLTQAPLAALLERLFTEAEASSPMNSAAFAGVSNAERERLMRSKTEYLQLYTQLKDFPLAVSRETGTLLYMLARSSNARHIVEFGTSFGLSTLHLAAALRDNGGGRLISSEFEPSKVEQARKHLAAGGLDGLVEIRLGDALQTLATDLPEQIDLGSARWRQGPVPTDPGIAGKPPATGSADRCRQRRLQPGVSGAGAGK